MDETQYILYEEYLGNEAVKGSSNNIHSSVTIPSLFITSNQNILHNFKAEEPSISNNILVNLTSNSNCYDKKTEDFHTLPISYEVKDAVVLHSEVVTPISANIGDVESSNTLCQTAVKSGANYEINFPPLTCSEILPSSTFLSTDSTNNNLSTTEATIQESIGLSRKNCVNLKNSESGCTFNSDLVTSESLQDKYPKLKKINHQGFVKLLQDDLLKFGTSVVKVIDDVGDETHHSLQIIGKENNKFNKMKIEYSSFISPLVNGFQDEAEKTVALQCSQNECTFSANDAVTNSENFDYLGNLSCINVLDSHDGKFFVNKNSETISVDNTAARFVQTENVHKLNLNCWKCLICLKELSSLVCLENHYSLHSAQELSKVLIKFHDPLYRLSCDNAATFNDENASHKVSCEENKKNKFFICPSPVIDSNLCDSSIVLQQNKFIDNSLNVEVGVAKSQPANEVVVKEIIKLKIKPQITQSHKQNDNQPMNIKKKEKVPNFENNGKKIYQPTIKETEKKINVLKTPTKILKNKKKSRSVGSGPGSRDPHQCSVCKKVLSSRGNLAKHLIQHQSMKPWSCSSCDASFNSKRDCDQHYMQRHTNIRPYVCQICSKGYVTSKTLDEHMNFHSTEKSFICKLCGKTFLTSKCVRRHMHRHESLKKFSCGMCYKLFRVKEDLFAHIRKVHLTKKKHIDNKHKLSGSNYSLSSSQLKGLENCVQLPKKKKKSKQKIENINKLSKSISEACQSDSLKEVAEFFIPAASAAVIFPELCELPSNIQIEKEEFYTNGENFVPVSTVFPLSAQGVTSKYIFNTFPSKNRIDADASNFVMLDLTEEDTGTMSSSHVLNCNSDLPVLFKQELSMIQHSKNDQRNIDQIFSTISTSNPESFSHEHQLIVKNGGRNTGELPNEDCKRETYSKNATNEQTMSKVTHHQPIIDQICVDDQSQNISLEMISQSLQLEFQNSQDVNNQNSIF